MLRSTLLRIARRVAERLSGDSAAEHGLLATDDPDLPVKDEQSRSSNPQASADDRQSTAFLDGLRGLAAVTVFIQHYCGGFTTGQHELGFGQDGNYHFASLPFIRIIWNGGNASVVIFFVLSGYVLSIGHLSKLRAGKFEACQRGLLSAILRRPIRLYLPPLVVSLIFALMLHLPGPVVLPVPWCSPEATIFAELDKYVNKSIEFFNPFRSHGSDQFWYPYNIVMWTIPIELKGSMLVFGILAVISATTAPSKDGRMLFVAGLLFCLAAVMLQLCLSWSMAAFIFGVVLAIVDTWKLDPKTIPEHARTAVLYLTFFAGWYLLSQPAHAGNLDFSSHTPGWQWLTAMIPAGYGVDKYYRYWQNWGALLFVFALLRLDGPQKMLSTRPCKFLGKVSFMLYLVHLPFFRTFGDRFHNLLGGGLAHESLEGGFWDATLPVPNIGPIGLSLRFLVCMAVVLPLSLIISNYGVTYIDQPAVRLGRLLTERLGIDKRRTEDSKDEPLLLPLRSRSF